jgi:hypothetical protein
MINFAISGKQEVSLAFKNFRLFGFDMQNAQDNFLIDLDETT